MSKKILLTGGTGFIGSHIAKTIVSQREEDLTVLVRGRNKKEAEIRLKNSC